jgi:hypothetical protein
MIPVFERAKTVDALDRASNVIGILTVSYIPHVRQLYQLCNACISAGS